jgi:hypothetical protein
MEKTPSKENSDWVKWLQVYGSGKFYDAFIRIAQGAKGKCVNCDEDIFLDIEEGGGVVDWKTEDGDYGCRNSPLNNDEGTGDHVPEKLD